jgi:hypothetical protein
MSEMLEDASFHRFRDWVLGEDNAPSLASISRSDLETLAACLSDIHDHCARIQLELNTLIGGARESEMLQSAVIDTEVQLALAVRNWRELKVILRRGDLWPGGPEVFDELSEFRDEAT